MVERGELPERERRSARVILLDAMGRVLLIRFVIGRRDGEYSFWAAPGGRVEEGETDVAAAARELMEELRLCVELVGPVLLVEGEFEFEGFWNRSVDVFFRGHCDVDEVTLHGASEDERSVLREVRWWSVAALEVATEPVFPKELAATVRRLGTMEAC